MQGGHLAIFYCRIQLKVLLVAWLQEEWGSTKVACKGSKVQELLTSLSEGMHDGLIADQLGLSVDDTPRRSKKRARHSQQDDKAEKVKASVKPAKRTYGPHDFVELGLPLGGVLKAWLKQYKEQVRNPAKQAGKTAGVCMDKFKFPSGCFVAEGDAADEADWKKVWSEAAGAGVIKPGLKVVVLCSPPWGVLEDTRAAYSANRDKDDGATYVDQELTTEDIGRLASAAFKITPADTPFLIHLPMLAVGKYVDIFEKNGWEVRSLCL